VKDKMFYWTPKCCYAETCVENNNFFVVNEKKKNERLSGKEFLNQNENNKEK
jgi:hypothetical protein